MNRNLTIGLLCVVLAFVLVCILLNRNRGQRTAGPAQSQIITQDGKLVYQPTNDYYRPVVIAHFPKSNPPPPNPANK